jgi:drug/metabolite transporter (DMT)-like permease
MRSRTAALAAIVLLMIIWGTTYIITKVAIREVPPLTLAALRFLITALVLLPFAIAAGGLKRLPKPFPILDIVSMAFTGFVLYYAFFNYALESASASQGALIQALIPVGVAITAVIVLKEKLSKMRTAGIALAVLGVAMIVLAGKSDSASPNPVLGAALMLFSVVAWSIYTVQVKRLADVEPTVLLTAIATVGTLIQLPLVAIELMQRPEPLAITARGWASVVFLGAIASGFGLLVYNRALRLLDASLVGTYINLVPIIGVVSAVLFLGESLQGWQIVGSVLALAGVWLAS